MRSTPFDKLVEQGWTMIAPDGSAWGAPLPSPNTDAVRDADGFIETNPDDHASRLLAALLSDLQVAEFERGRARARIVLLEGRLEHRETQVKHLLGTEIAQSYQRELEALTGERNAMADERDALRRIVECEHPEEHWKPLDDPSDPDRLDPWYGCDLCGFERQQDDDVMYAPDCPWEWRINMHPVGRSS